MIADLDIKLDFVPPSLINFISRQLIGNGFRLYKKVRKLGFGLALWNVSVQCQIGNSCDTVLLLECNSQLLR